MTSTAGSHLASTFSRALLRQLIAVGVQHVVLSPGSRSQALALAAAQLEAEGRLQLHVRTDERSAGFLALGLALESGAPAVAITTSGSAVANLLPAVLEAHHAGVPLLLLTADRPARLRGIRSNQTTRQDLMLSSFTSAFQDITVPSGDSRSHDEVEPEWRHDIATQVTQLAEWAWLNSLAGPVQLNLQYTEPLSGFAEDIALPVPVVAAVSGAGEALTVEAGPRTLVVAGARAGARAEEFARELGAPLIAEIVSGAHFGPQLVVAYRELLQLAEFGESIERVVVFGTPTLSREIGIIGYPGLELIVVDSPGADRFTPAHRSQAAQTTYAAAVRAHGEPNAESREWGQVWVSASRKLRADAEQARAVETRQSGVAYGGHVEDFAAQRDYVTNELAAIRAPIDRERLVEAVWAATWPHDRIVFGASRLVRVADATLAGKTAQVFANRGQSGIDGTIATGIGIALAAEGGMTRVLLGDLAALHDAGSLRLAPGERLPAIQVIVGNDHGGTIFDSLEVAQSADPAAFDRVQLTPHDVDFAALAAAYGWEYRLAENAGALDQALTASSDRPVLIEVPLQR